MFLAGLRFFCWLLIQGSSNYLFGGHQAMQMMQMYGKFEGFPISALFGLVIMTPVI